MFFRISKLTGTYGKHQLYGMLQSFGHPELGTGISGGFRSQAETIRSGKFQRRGKVFPGNHIFQFKADLSVHCTGIKITDPVFEYQPVSLVQHTGSAGLHHQW